MAHIEKRTRNGRVTYRARYRDPAGREKARVFNRRVDAQRFLTEVENSKLRGTWTDPALGRVLFQEWLAEWWSTTTNLRPSTRARDEMLLRRYALPRFGNQQLAAIRQPEVRAWVADLAGTELAPSTVRKAYHLLGKVLAAAVDAGMIAQSPCQRVPLPKIEREEMRFLTPAEIARLADAIRSRYRALVLVGAYGGLRIGELAGLRRSRVDLLRGTVEVAEMVTEVGGRLRVGPPKTRASRRTVGLPRAVVEELAAHLATPAPPDAFVFTAPKGGPLRVIAFRARIWRPATRTAGLDGLRIHDLRHTAVACGSRPGPTPRKSPPAPGIPRWGSPSIATATCIPSPMPPSATGWTPSTRPAIATKTPPWWTYFRSARGPGAIPEHRGRRRHWAGNGCDLHGAAHR
jgi:integrase